MVEDAPIAAGWAVVMTRPASEELAERSIGEAGFRAYLPRYRRMLQGYLIRDGRRVRTRGPGEIVARPLFPRYLFAELHPGQAEDGLGSARGVDHVLRPHRASLETAPATLVRAEVLEAIRLNVDRGRFDTTGKRTDIKAGDPVGIDSGDYERLIGELLDLDEKGRAHVLLEFLGRPVRAEVSAGALSPVPISSL